MGLTLLDQLALKYGTDKFGKHNYTQVYSELFPEHARDLVKKVLEIGTAEGAGLYMLREYFYNATIFGAEFDQHRVDLMKETNRIQVYQCDQSSSRDLKFVIHHTGGDLDLVIDDGSHIPQHQLFTCLELMPLLSNQVVYVIEDVSKQGADWIFENIINAGYPARMVRVGTRHDDQLIIVRQK